MGTNDVQVSISGFDAYRKSRASVKKKTTTTTTTTQGKGSSTGSSSVSVPMSSSPVISFSGLSKTNSAAYKRAKARIQAEIQPYQADYGTTFDKDKYEEHQAYMETKAREIREEFERSYAEEMAAKDGAAQTETKTVVKEETTTTEEAATAPTTDNGLQLNAKEIDTDVERVSIEQTYADAEKAVQEQEAKLGNLTGEEGAKARLQALTLRRGLDSMKALSAKTTITGNDDDTKYHKEAISNMFGTLTSLKGQDNAHDVAEEALKNAGFHGTTDDLENGINKTDAPAAEETTPETTTTTTTEKTEQIANCKAKYVELSKTDKSPAQIVNELLDEGYGSDVINEAKEEALYDAKVQDAVDAF